MLGARHLRLLSFDTAWRNDLEDETIISLTRDERRIILTRDKGILQDGRVTHGYWLRETVPLAHRKWAARPRRSRRLPAA